MNSIEQNTQILNGEVVFTYLTPKLTKDLSKHSYFFSALERGDVLNHGLRYEMLKAVKLVPHSTRLVAYHTQEKKAVGFLYLEENTDWLYTIEYVFVDPKYRKRGLATKLLNFAMILAKNKGAKKVNLNVDLNSTKAIALYKKLGFKEIGNTLLVQRYSSGYSPFRIIKHIFNGQGVSTKLALGRKSQLCELETNSRKNREILFKIYQRCMDRRWIDFFEINTSNLVSGSRYVWQPPFFRDALVNEPTNSFALVFNSPFSSKATVELYSSSDGVILSMLKDLLEVLENRGVSFSQITLFNTIGNTFSSFFHERKLAAFRLLAMGKNL